MQSILIDEGFEVVALKELEVEKVTAAIAKLRPDCVLLDGAQKGSYGDAWQIARWIAMQPRRVATIMLTAYRADYDEALLDESERAREAAFVGTIPKPFQIDHLVTTVGLAVAWTLSRPPPLTLRT